MRSRPRPGGWDQRGLGRKTWGGRSPRGLVHGRFPIKRRRGLRGSQGTRAKQSRALRHMRECAPPLPPSSSSSRNHGFLIRNHGFLIRNHDFITHKCVHSSQKELVSNSTFFDETCAVLREISRRYSWCRSRGFLIKDQGFFMRNQDSGKFMDFYEKS